MKIEKREEKLNKVRQRGLVPGVIYGKEIDATSIQVDYKSLIEAYKNYGRIKTFKINMGRKTHEVYIKDIDFNKAKDEDVIHFGLLKVSTDDSITADLPIKLIGEDSVQREGFIVQQIINIIPVSYPATESIDSIELDISHLNVGDALYVKDLSLPDNFSTIIDAGEMVVNIIYPNIEEIEDVKTNVEDNVVEKAEDDTERSEEE